MELLVHFLAVFSLLQAWRCRLLSRLAGLGEGIHKQAPQLGVVLCRLSDVAIASVASRVELRARAVASGAMGSAIVALTADVLRYMVGALWVVKSIDVLAIGQAGGAAALAVLLGFGVLVRSAAVERLLGVMPLVHRVMLPIV
ncbi:unnamed protein product [Prorocentrum cordatum]|uniref:Protein RFT1 homolog n=1 Tax=Prorocentrum cordatum TaxID=2364126 RepID=A0ABN9XUJ3_9DINO|nr:unnamed protein product [Polarella glacialis]